VHCNILTTASNTFLVSSDTTQPGTSGIENEPPLLPAYENETPSLDEDNDVEYEVPHVVNTTEGPPSGGSSGISPAYGGRRGSRELRTSRMLSGRGGMGGIRDPAEEKKGKGGKQTNYNIIERDSEYYYTQTV
jgi:hypothetical protein